MRVLDKFELLLSTCGVAPLNRGANPYQDAATVIQVRNAIAHYQPQDLSVDLPNAMEKRLRGRFPDNPLMAGGGNPWWPDHCLGSGFALWAFQSVTAFADEVFSAVRITPNYARLRDQDWDGMGKSPSALD